jgi:hypothetical protein
MKKKLTTTIAEALGEGGFLECRMDDCHLPFQSEKALGQHFIQADAVYAVEGWETKSRRLALRWSERIEDAEESSITGERNEVEEGRRGRGREQEEPARREPVETERQEEDEERNGEPNAEAEVE